MSLLCFHFFVLLKIRLSNFTVLFVQLKHKFKQGKTPFKKNLLDSHFTFRKNSRDIDKLRI